MNAGVMRQQAQRNIHSPSLFARLAAALAALALCGAPLSVAAQTSRLLNAQTPEDFTAGSPLRPNRFASAAGKVDSTALLGKDKNWRTRPAAQFASADEEVDPGRLRELTRSINPGGRFQQMPVDRLLGGLTKEQKANLERLQETAQDPGNLSVAFSRDGTPSHLKANDLTEKLSVVVKTILTPQEKASRFLSSNAALLRLQDPGQELQLSGAQKDNLGKTRFRYQQHYKGLPVWGKEASVYLDERGAVYLFQGSYVPSPHLADVSARITASDAIARAYADLNFSEQPAQEPKAELVIHHGAEDGTYRVVWHLELFISIGSRWHYFVDAVTGEIVNKYSGIHTGAVSASGRDLDGQTQSFTAWQSGSSYYMIDVTRPTDDRTTADPAKKLGAAGDMAVLDAAHTKLQGSTSYAFLKSTSATSGWDASGISALSGMYKTLDYYKNTHGRDSFDGSGATLLMFVHYGQSEANAFWNGSSMVFGDGDGGRTASDLAAGLDVMAHEFTHAVVEHTAGLEYQAQSGALNESFADFFGAMVDRSNWLIGEKVWAGGVLRSLQDPHKGYRSQPSSMTEYQNLPTTADGDHGGVHINSGIPNRAAYLIAEGLTTEGKGTSIGKEKTEKIWYRALTTYLQKHSQFIDARRATVQAATDLYGAGSAEEKAVKAGWDAVKVTDSATGSPSSRKPTDVDPVSGADQLIYVSNSGIYLRTSAGNYGPLNTYYARDTKPAVVTGPGGSLLFYITTAGSIRAILLNTGQDVSIGGTGYWSIAVTPDASKVALTKSVAEPYVYILDLNASTTKSFLLTNPATDGATGASTIVKPDVITFDYAGNQVLFDALNEVQVSGFGAYDFWAIGILDIRDGNIVQPLPAQDPTLSVGNPAFATNNNYVIVWDVIDNVTGESAVVLHNTRARTVSALTPDLDGRNRSVAGRPTFTGDDTGVAMKVCRGTYTTCPDELPLLRVPVVKSGDQWTLSATGTSWAADYAGDFPVYFRSTARSLSGKLSVSPSSLAFGEVAAGSSKTASVTVANTGNVDVDISDIAVTGTGFSHDGINGLLPRGESMTITVTYAPTTSGSSTGTLSITSDASGSPNKVSLSGTGGASGSTNGFAVSATSSGTTSNLTLAVSMSIATADVGRTGRLYLAAAIGKYIFCYNGSSWVEWTGGELPSFAQGELLPSISIPIASGSDFSSLVGTSIFLGYGQDTADLITRQTYGLAYVIH